MSAAAYWVCYLQPSWEPGKLSLFTTTLEPCDRAPNTFGWSSKFRGRDFRLTVVVYADAEPNLGTGRPHETQHITSNGVAWDSRGHAYSNDSANALSSYFFNERCW